MKLIYEKEVPQKIDRVRCFETEVEEVSFGKNLCGVSKNNLRPTKIEIKTGEFETLDFVYLTHLINSIEKFHRIIIE